MIDKFAERVVTELKGVKSIDEAKAVANSILDSADFQNKVPKFRVAVSQQTTINGVHTLMWNIANSGMRIKNRYM